MTETEAVNPALWDTSDSPSAFDPADWFDYCATLRGRRPPALPPLAIQSVINAPYERAHLDLVKRRYGAEADDFTMSAHPISVFRCEGQEVALATSPKGSYAAGGLDELIALGARRIVVLNVGAALTEEVSVGSVVAASKALRDDGVSFHYQAASRYIDADKALTKALVAGAEREGIKVHEGPVWTNPAHFRLSVDRLRAFRKEGCLVLENEVAAALAVAAHRGVEAAALVHVGLSLATDRFRVPSESELYGPEAAAKQLDIALAALMVGRS
jgi:uridine phosphorylase